MRAHELIKREASYLLAECNFTERESKLFSLRSKEYTLEKCAELMDVSVSTVSRIHKGMKSKIYRVQNEKEI